VLRCHLTYAAIALLSGMGGSAVAADWPQWGGHPHRNMVGRETNLPAGFVPGDKRPDGAGIDLRTTRNVRWVSRLGTQTYGNPTVARGRVFVGTNDFALGDPRFTITGGGAVKCFDESDGRLLWQLVVPRHFTHDPLFNFDNMELGVCSSVAVDGDRAYVVTNRCEVLCLDVQGMANGNDGPYTDEARYFAGPGRAPVAPGPSDGDILWRYDMIRELPCWPQDAASSSPLVVGDFVYVGTSNGTDKNNVRVPLPDCPSLIVLDKHTGKLVAWDDARIGGRLFHGQWSSPSAGRVRDKTLVFYGGGDGVCYAFEALDGVADCPRPLRTAWSFDCNPPEFRVKLGKPIPYPAGDARRKLGNANDGDYVGPCEIIATPVFHEGRVYVAIGQDPAHGLGRGALWCIDASRTGDITASAKIWHYDGIQRSLSTVSIAGDLLFVADLAGTIHCLDVATGRPLWLHKTKAEVWGSTLVADGKLYLGTQKSLWVLAASKEKKVLGEIRLGSPVHATPIAANGVLYVASQRYLWAACDRASLPVLNRPADVTAHD
jgi:outer membrane protein assembly factor BamB